jgi:deoxycytidylate deaminase
MMAARDEAVHRSQDAAVPTGSVVARDGKIIGRGANGSNYHQLHGCRRVQLGIPTGQRYDLCEGCSPKNHSEPKAISAAIAGGHDTNGADLYLWGHWWCCEPCWNAIISAHINQVYLLQDSEKLFNKADPMNILPRASK